MTLSESNISYKGHTFLTAHAESNILFTKFLLCYSQLLVLQMEQMGALIEVQGGGGKGILGHLLTAGRKFSVQWEVIPQRYSLVSLCFRWIETRLLLCHLLHVRALGIGRSIKLAYIICWLECYQLSTISSPYSAVTELKGVTKVATHLVIFLKWYFPTFLLLPLLFQSLIQSPSPLKAHGFYVSIFTGPLVIVHVTLESFCSDS